MDRRQLVQFAATLPLVGCVNRKEDFYYIELDEQWNYCCTKDFILQCLREIYSEHPTIISDHAKLMNIFAQEQQSQKSPSLPLRFFLPPSPVGYHITTEKDVVGKMVSFIPISLCLWTNKELGQASLFDPTKFISTWLVLKVKLLDYKIPELIDIEPHITLACVGICIPSPQ